MIKFHIVQSQLCLTEFMFPQETLVDFSLTSTDIWAVWVDESNNTVVKYINFEQ